MSHRAAARLAWSLLALVLLILALGLILWSPDAGFFLTFALIAAEFAVVGALVASRRPQNPIGWLFLAIAVVATFVASADQYAVYTLVEHPGSLPGGAWVAWLASGICTPPSASSCSPSSCSRTGGCPPRAGARWPGSPP